MLNDLPREANYRNSLSGQSRYVLFANYPEIFVEKVGSRWLFSTYTVRTIEELHDQTYPFGLIYS
ncbi:MAG: hypothetical protein HC880_16910 [Bacteroidia bacterium]|nr:hypothetical protein [Bacteroidia bacterium]